jgi:hypothetical protein
VIGLYGAVAAIVGLFAWREVNLWGLPDVGDPFEVAAFRLPDVPDDQNAFLLYRKALDRIRVADPRDLVKMRDAHGGMRSWSDPALRGIVAANREALELWRRGTERPDSLDRRDGRLVLLAPQNVTIDGVALLSWLPLIEAARLESAGDLAGAWAWYHALLRSSRHFGRNGAIAHRAAGLDVLTMARGPLLAWADRVGDDAALLRRALEETRAILATTAPDSMALKHEYLLTLRDLAGAVEEPVGLAVAGPPSMQALARWPEARRFLRHEPERTLRVARLVFANRLSAADRPASRRPQLVPPWPGVYDTTEDPVAPASARRLSPRALAAWSGTATLPRATSLAWQQMDVLARDERARAGLIVALAERLFAIEHGRPPRSPEELVGTILDRLPEGYVPPSQEPSPPRIG